MPSANASISEIDLSTRVPSFPGAFGGIVIPAVKGPVNQPVLVTSQSQLLSIFTPDEKVEVGFDLAYFSAMAYLEKSDKLWAVRAAKDAIFGGALIREEGSSNDNSPLPSSADLTDPEGFTFDSLPDQPGVAEVTEYDWTGLSGSDFDVSGSGLSFQFWDGGDNPHYIWVNVTDGANSQSDPGLSGTAHQLDVLAADAATDLASKHQALVDGLTEFSASVSSTVVTVTNATEGDATDATDVDSGVSITITTQGQDEIDNQDELILIHGSSPGAFANDIRITITNFTDDETRVAIEGSFIIDVYKASNTNDPIESHRVSRIPGLQDGRGRNLYIEDVLQASNYIRAQDNQAVDENVLPQSQQTPLALADGDNGTAVTDAEFITAAQALSNPDDIFTTLLMDGGHATSAYALELTSIAENRKDSVALLSTPFAAEASSSYITDLLEYRNTDLNINSSYAALYTPHVRIFDRFNSRNLFVSPEGYAAGVISETAANEEIWFPPAGFKRGILNVLDLKRRFTKGEMDTLYDNGINPLRFAPGRGIAIWGQKTLLSRPSALDRLNVRLMLITVEPAIKEAMEDFLFELNDSATRGLAVAVISGALDRIQARRGITEYRVVSDASNNSPQDIDNHIMNVDVFVRPTPSLEFIPVRMIITPQSLSFELAAQAV